MNRAQEKDRAGQKAYNSGMDKTGSFRTAGVSLGMRTNKAGF